MARTNTIRCLAGAAALAWMMAAPAPALAHCDGLDGPVVAAAQRALETRNVALVLIWVQPADEREIQAAFAQTLAVRAMGPEARQLADRFFFETLVRLHRAGEGAPYTGLVPAGRDLGPAIPAADRAIEARSVEPVVHLLTAAIEEQVRDQFAKVIAARQFDPNDVAAGRAYVGTYVEFIHLVERLYESAATVPHGHFEEAAAHATGH